MNRAVKKGAMHLEIGADKQTKDHYRYLMDIGS